MARSWILSCTKPRTHTWRPPQGLAWDLGRDHPLAPHSLSCNIFSGAQRGNSKGIISIRLLGYSFPSEGWLGLLLSCVDSRRPLGGDRHCLQDLAETSSLAVKEPSEAKAFLLSIFLIILSLYLFGLEKIHPDDHRTSKLRLRVASHWQLGWELRPPARWRMATSGWAQDSWSTALLPHSQPIRGRPRTLQPSPQILPIKTFPPKPSGSSGFVSTHHCPFSLLDPAINLSLLKKKKSSPYKVLEVWRRWLGGDNISPRKRGVTGWTVSLPDSYVEFLTLNASACEYFKIGFLKV